MKSIGEKLKQRRIELGYSIEDLHEKTKLSEVHIKAIEDGDLDYFRHDISYLKFFLQYYCQAVYLDYEDFEEEFKKTLDVYHETQLLKKKESHQASNENIQRRIQNNQKKYHKAKGQTNIQFSKLDHQTLIVIGIVLVILAVLVFGFFKLILPNLTSEPVDNNQPPAQVQEPDINDEPTPDPDIVVERPKVEEGLTITEESYDKYRIFGVEKNEMVFRIDFTNDTWVETYINDKAVNDPLTGTYVADEFIEIPITETTDKITILFGNLDGSSISVNGEPVELNQQAILGTSVTLNFFFGKE
jgi:transcriptional regulator with XRE-family HTH domain